MTTVSATNPYAVLNTATTAPQTANEAGSADRFLKLLVTQMQNQDPLNPMDNAQITSQMAQINTVNGIEQLNTTVQGLNGQFAQLQALSGAALVGHDVTLQGNRLDVRDGVGLGGYELAGNADTVKIEVLNGAGRVIETVQLGAETAGRHAFEWDASQAAAGESYSFRVTARSGAAAVTATQLTRDRVLAVSAGASGLVLQTEHAGDIGYADVKAFN